MNKTWLQLKAYLTFDNYDNYSFIYKRFETVHKKRCELNKDWPVSATRLELVSDFWYGTILHYAFLVFTCVLFLLCWSNWVLSNMPFIIFSSIAVYALAYFVLYRPIYISSFLPKMEVAAFTFENREKSRIEKCRQEQLSTRGLVLLFYILDKCAEVNFLTPSDKSASLLLKIFGVSQKGLKNELDLLFKKEKRAKIEQRKQTEIAKSFEEVYAILEEMQFPRGVQMLKELEIRFNRPE